MVPRHESSVLVARSRGWGRRYTFDFIPVEALFSLGTLLSTHIAPSFPFVLARRSRQADLVALHQPFPLNDIGVALGLPSRTAPTRSPRCSDARFACSWPNRSYAAQDTLRCYSSLHARAGCGGLDCVQALQRGGCCILIRFSPAGAFDGEAFIVDRHEPVRSRIALSGVIQSRFPDQPVATTCASPTAAWKICSTRSGRHSDRAESCCRRWNIGTNSRLFLRELESK